tara:strand:+ start:2265 stop:2546 length:282 start_codon:yes stop_codon:yes gene_type:complete
MENLLNLSVSLTEADVNVYMDLMTSQVRAEEEDKNGEAMEAALAIGRWADSHGIDIDVEVTSEMTRQERNELDKWKLWKEWVRRDVVRMVLAS